MSKLEKQALGKTVRNLRLQRGYPQKEIADFLGYTRSTYSYKENGITWFHINDLALLADFFQVPVDLFFHPEQNLLRSKGRRAPRKLKGPKNITINGERS